MKGRRALYYLELIRKASGLQDQITDEQAKLILYSAFVGYRIERLHEIFTRVQSEKSRSSDAKGRHRTGKSLGKNIGRTETEVRTVDRPQYRSCGRARLIGKQSLENLGRGGFTTGGIFCALSDTTPEVTLEAMQAARRYGVVISYDLNYRDSLWKSIGGKKGAQEVNRRLAPLVDVMLGNEEDFSAARGYEVSGVDESHQNLPVESFKKMIAQVVNDFKKMRCSRGKRP